MYHFLQVGLAAAEAETEILVTQHKYQEMNYMAKVHSDQTKDLQELVNLMHIFFI